MTTAGGVEEEVTRVLTVDDTPDDRALVRREAEALFPRAEIVEAGTRAEFEAVLAAGGQGPGFDLIVTDLALKWGNGREVLERVRAVCPACPVVMFTASGDETIAVELMKAGLDDYVVKSARQLPRLRASLKMAVEHARNRSALTLREQQLAAALARQQVLVRELHHRVRNNLQTIDSLLRLRARASGNGAVAAQLGELAGRMQALATVQSRIYETETLDRVDFAAALGDIADSLVAAYSDGERRRIVLARDFDGPLELDVSRAMPLGLLAYEVVLNALKHAWPDGRPGRLGVELRTRRQRTDPVEIQVRDDGIGFVDGEAAQGLGSRLIRALADEAHAEVTTLSEPGGGGGTTVRVRLL